MKRFVRVLTTMVLLYAAVVVYVAVRQDAFFYQPIKESESALLKLAASSRIDPVRNDAGEIVAWHFPNATAPRRIAVFHGGAGHALHRTFYAQSFHALGWDVLLFEFPGFSARSGVPGKDIFAYAGGIFLETLLDDPRPLYLLGESMGSGTVCTLASEFPQAIHGVALVVPYARLVEVGQWHLPYLPINLILRDRYDNIAALRDYHGPVTIVVAEEDEVVSAAQGRKLYESYAGPKQLISLAGCKHAGFPTTPGAEWWRQVSDSFQNTVTPTEAAVR